MSRIPINMLGLIQKCSGYVLHGRPACDQNWARSEVPDLISRVRFCSILAKKAGIILCKASPDPILTALSCIGQTDLVWKQVGVQESSGPLLAERKQPARLFPTFRLGCVLPQTAFFMTAQSRCVQESLGPLLANASVLIQTGCGSDPARLLGYSTFTGI